MIGLFFLYILLIIVLISGISVIFAYFSMAPWMPTKKSDIYRALDLAELKEGEVLHDLGCGFGSIPIVAAKKYKAKAIGIELSFMHFVVCELRKFLNPDLLLEYKFKNFYKENLENADVVYLFGTPGGINQKFLKKMKDELKPGARLISYTFKIKTFVPDQVSQPTEKDRKIYLYKF